jgi:hypothetical protein
VTAPVADPQVWHVPAWLETWFRYAIGELPTADEYAPGTCGLGGRRSESCRKVTTELLWTRDGSAR